MGEPHQIIMKAFIFVTLLAAAYAIEDTAEVAAAKEAFMAAFAKAEAGEHAALAPAPVATAAPVAAPVVSYAAYPQYYNNWNAAYNAYGYNGAYYNNWAGYGAYPYAHAAYPYAHAGYPYAYAGYP